MSSFINQFKTLFFSYFVSAIAVSETKEEEKKKKKDKKFPSPLSKKINKKGREIILRPLDTPDRERLCQIVRS